MFDRVLGALALCATFGAPAAACAEIFLTNRGDNSVLVFADDANGDVAPVRRIAGPATRFAGLNGIAVDTRNHELFVSSQSNEVLVFDLDANGDAAPRRVIGGPATRLSFPAGLAVDSVNDELYVVNLANDELFVFDRRARGNTAPIRSIGGPATGILQPTGVFVDAEADLVFVSNESRFAPAVNAFDRTATGNVAPARTIAGTATTLQFAVGLFRHPIDRELTVGDLRRGELLTFAADASGNVPPVRVATTPGVSDPAGTTLTLDDEILFTDNSANAIFGIDRSSSGVAAATRRVSGPRTGIRNPVYLATTRSVFPGAVRESDSAPVALDTRAANAETFELDTTDAAIRTGDFGDRKESIPGFANLRRTDASRAAASDDVKIVSPAPGVGDNAAVLFEFQSGLENADVAEIAVEVEAAQGVSGGQGEFFVYLYDYTLEPFGPAAIPYRVLGSGVGSADQSIRRRVSSRPADFIDDTGQITLLLVNGATDTPLAVDRVHLLVRPAARDEDADGVVDDRDLCPFEPDPAQRDAGGVSPGPDGIGDACQCGDVSDDGSVDLTDVVVLSRSLAGLPPGTAAPAKCDVAASARCDSRDLDAVREAIAGLAGLAQICAPALGL